MGYYSDVGLALSKEAATRFKTLLATLDEKNKTSKYIKNFILNHAQRRSDAETGEELYLWNDVKWYSFYPREFPEIEFVDNFLDDLDDEEYLFISIGEELDDIQYKGSFYDNKFNLGIERKLVTA